MIDAYNGSVTFYVFDPSDPLIRTYEKIFPGMFKPEAEMPASLQGARALPAGLLCDAGADVRHLSRDRPRLLYNKGNQWEIPKNVSISGERPMSPYYMIMRLPGQIHEEFVLILPYVPNARSNMIAWLGAESDTPNYGKAVSFEFPVQPERLRPGAGRGRHQPGPRDLCPAHPVGPGGFDRDLRQPADGAHWRLAALCAAALPESSQTKLPQIQRIVVFYRSPSSNPDLPSGQQQNVVMAPTLGEALASIFGGAASPGTPPGSTEPPPNTTPTSPLVAQLIAQADLSMPLRRLRCGQAT